MKPVRFFSVAAALAFIFACASLAQDAADNKTEQQGKKMWASGERGKMPMRVHMENMIKLKSDLDQAKGMADAKGESAIAAKINDALNILAENHKMMHQHMMKARQMMKMKMAKHQEIMSDMEDLKTELGKNEQTKPMQQKVEQIIEKMQGMRGMMGKEAKDGEMKCPMCKQKMSDQGMMRGDNATMSDHDMMHGSK